MKFNLWLQMIESNIQIPWAPQPPVPIPMRMAYPYMEYQYINNFQHWLLAESTILYLLDLHVATNGPLPQIYFPNLYDTGRTFVVHYVHKLIPSNGFSDKRRVAHWATAKAPMGHRHHRSFFCEATKRHGFFVVQRQPSWYYVWWLGSRRHLQVGMSPWVASICRMEKTSSVLTSPTIQLVKLYGVFWIQHLSQASVNGISSLPATVLDSLAANIRS